MNVRSVKVGRNLDCKYPVHGTRNVLKRQSGVVEETGRGPHGPFATIKRTDGTYRRLSFSRMIDASQS